MKEMKSLNNEENKGATSLMTCNHQRPKWPTDLNESIPKPGQACSTIITRVPPAMNMNIIDADRYIHAPKLVSIGPFHRNNPSLQAMESFKLRFLARFLNRFEHKDDPDKEKSLFDKLEEAMKELESEVRKCYVESFDNLSSNEYVQMIVLDGCFILEVLLLNWFATEENVPNPIFTTRFMAYNLWGDFLMLENQLPFIVLQRIYSITLRLFPKHNGPPLHHLAIYFFSSHISVIADYRDAEEEHKHLLALFHSCLRRKGWSSPDNSPYYWPMRGSSLNYMPMRGSTKRWFGTAAELLCAGIEFRKLPTRYPDITFANSVLEIPPLVLDEGTTLFLRNMVAYEQCNASADPYFTNLLIFFKNLVGSPKDVEYLRRAGIIETLGSNEEAANVLKKLTKGVVISMDDCCYGSVITEINDHCRRQWSVPRGTLRIYYFINRDPMRLMLFILTVVQTISSIYQVIFDSIKCNNS